MFFTLIMGLLGVPAYCPPYNAYGDFDFAQMWYAEVPVPKLVIGSLVCYPLMH